MTGVTLHHLVGGLEAGVRDLGHAQLLMVRLLRRDHGRIGNLPQNNTNEHFLNNKIEFSTVKREMLQNFETGGD